MVAEGACKGSAEVTAIENRGVGPVVPFPSLAPKDLEIAPVRVRVARCSGPTGGGGSAGER